MEFVAGDFTMGWFLTSCLSWFPYNTPLSNMTVKKSQPGYRRANQAPLISCHRSEIWTKDLHSTATVVFHRTHEPFISWKVLLPRRQGHSYLSQWSWCFRDQCWLRTTVTEPFFTQGWSPDSSWCKGMIQWGRDKHLAVVWAPNLCLPQSPFQNPSQSFYGALKPKFTLSLQRKRAEESFFFLSCFEYQLGPSKKKYLWFCSKQQCLLWALVCLPHFCSLANTMP